MAVMKSKKEPAKKKKIRIVLPIENVEYTFRFPPKRQIVYRWFGDYDGERLLLYNKTGRYYTKMSKVYFTLLLKDHLIRREAVNVMEPPEEMIVPKEIVDSEEREWARKEKEEEIKRNEVTPLDSDSLVWTQNVVRELSKIKVEDRLYIQRHFGYKPEMTVERLIVDFENAIKKGISDKGFGVLCSRYIKMTNSLSEFLSGLGGCR